MKRITNNVQNRNQPTLESVHFILSNIYLIVNQEETERQNKIMKMVTLDIIGQCKKQTIFENNICVCNFSS